MTFLTFERDKLKFIVVNYRVYLIMYWETLIMMVSLPQKITYNQTLFEEYNFLTKDTSLLN